MTKATEKKETAQKDGWKFPGSNGVRYCVYCGGNDNLREIITTTQVNEEQDILLHQFFICRHCGLNYHGLWIKSIGNMVKHAIEHVAVQKIIDRFDKKLQERQAVKKHIKKRFNHKVTESADDKQE